MSSPRSGRSKSRAHAVCLRLWRVASGARRNYAVGMGDIPRESRTVEHRGQCRSRHDLLDRMLELAQVSQEVVLYDLGSGDGRIVITAAKRYKAKAVGFEIDPALVRSSQRSIREAGVEALAEIREQDIRTVDLAPASVVTMYLYPGANLRLRAAILRQLKPGSRVVSHDFSMGDWKPYRVERMTDSGGFLRTIYLWRIEDPNTR